MPSQRPFLCVIEQNPTKTFLSGRGAGQPPTLRANQWPRGLLLRHRLSPSGTQESLYLGNQRSTGWSPADNTNSSPLGHRRTLKAQDIALFSWFGSTIGVKRS